jgi:hypothetical protein
MELPERRRGEAPSLRRRVARPTGFAGRFLAALLVAIGPAHAAGDGGVDPVPASERLALFAARALAGNREIRSISARARIVFRLPDGARALDERRELVAPDKLRRTMVVDGEEHAVVISGGRGFIGSGDRWLPLSGERLHEALTSIDRELLVLAAGVGGSELEIVGSWADRLDGSACDDIAISLRGVESRLCIDERGDVLRQAFVGADPRTGALGPIDVLFSDARDAGGVRYPYRQEIRVDGRPLATVIVEHLAVNDDLDPAMFRVPGEP